jgi:hypothetical protein
MDYEDFKKNAGVFEGYKISVKSLKEAAWKQI